MTRKLKISSGRDLSSTAISNLFIDRYMADANGSYVKVYIYLLRCLSDPSMEVSVYDISEHLDETENVIIKALRYWARKDLLSIEYGDDDQIIGVSVPDLVARTRDTEAEEPARSRKSENVGAASAKRSESADTASSKRSETVSATGKTGSLRTAPAAASSEAPDEIIKPTYSNSQIESFLEDPGYRALIDHIEDRFGHTLTQKDLQTPSFLFEELGFSTELITFLVDYSIGRDKRSFSYIEKVARDWYSRGITTVLQAKEDVFTFSAEYKGVCSAFGLKRTLGEKELDFVSRWIGLSMGVDLIKEACSRSLMNTGKPSFEYANTILEGWHARSVRTLDDVAAIDSTHESQVKEREARADAHKALQARQAKNIFNQFPQREYTVEDYRRFEQKKLSLNP